MSSENCKYLIVVRHAKSSWKETYLQDHDRPLNKRGLRDAPIMADHLKNNIDFVPDFIVSSSARRAKDTAMYFKDVFSIHDEKFMIVKELYHASDHRILDIITRQNNTSKSIMLFAHNPGINDFVDHVTSENIDNIPTCGTAVIRFDIRDWSEIKTTKGNLEQYYYPKGI